MVLPPLERSQRCRMVENVFIEFATHWLGAELLSELRYHSKSWARFF